MNPQITIIIPTYQRPAYLHRALSSITSSLGDGNIEVVVIDDDRDATAASVISQFPAVRYFAKREIRRGQSASRNIGLRVALGAYVIFLDDDDYFMPGALNHYLKAINHEISFYYANFITSKNGNNILTTLESLRFDRLLVKNIIPMGAFMVRRLTLQSEFDEKMKSHEDWEFILSNIMWETSRHINHPVVCIDKDGDGDHLSQRRKSFSWMEYIAIYSKFPAPHLAKERQDALAHLGISIPEELLKNIDIT